VKFPRSDNTSTPSFRVHSKNDSALVSICTMGHRKFTLSARFYREDMTPCVQAHMASCPNDHIFARCDPTGATCGYPPFAKLNIRRRTTCLLLVAGVGQSRPQRG
jgi:hypothetical protein